MVLLLGLIAWVMVVLKAALVPITIDEASTYLDFVQSRRFLPGLSKWEANNHLLNSFLTILSSALFGNKPFALRLPNVLMFGVFIFQANIFIQRTLQHFKSALTLSLLLFFSPLIIEFFSLCRGYGLSLALLLWFVNALLSASKNGNSNYAQLILSGALMVSANLNLLPTYIAGLAIMTFLQAKQKKINTSASFIWIAIVGIFVFQGVLLKEHHCLYYGTNNFLEVTLGYTSALYVGSDLLFWYFIPVMAVILVHLFSGSSARKWKSDFVVLFLLLTAAFVAPIAQHFLLGSPFPQDRTFMHVLVLACLIFAVVLDQRSIQMLNVGLVYSAVILIGFFTSFKIDRSVLWPNDVISEGTLDELMKHHKSQGTPPIVFSDFKFSSVWDYTNTINEANIHYFKPEQLASNTCFAADYFLLNKDSLLPCETGLVDTVRFDPGANYLLAKRRSNLPFSVDTQLQRTNAFPPSREYYGLIEDSIAADSGKTLVLNIESGLCLPSDGTEFQLVFEQKSVSGTRRESINLYRHYSSGQISGSENFQIRIPVNTLVNSYIVAYFWNLQKLEVQYTESTIKLESRPVH